MDLVLNLALIAIGLLTVLVVAFVAIFRPNPPDPENILSKLGRAALVGYGGLSALLLVWAIRSFIGPNGTSPRIPDRDLLRVDHLGYYVEVARGSSARIRFGGGQFDEDETRTGFTLPALSPGQEIRLRANSSDGRSIQSWTVWTADLDSPLRIGKTCVNLDQVHILADGDTLFLHLESNGDEGSTPFISLTRRGGDGERLLYNQGHVTASGQRVFDAREGVDLGRTPIRNATRLSSLVDRVPNVSANWSEISKAPFLLGTTRGRVSPWSAARGITLVRDRLDDPSSPLGFIVSPSLFDAGVKTFKNGIALPTRQTTLRDIGSSEGAAISYGLGRSAFGLQLPTTFEKAEGSTRLVALLSQPARWALPSNLPAGKPLLLSSGGDVVPLDGYTFSTGNDGHPFYAKAKIDTSTGTIEVQDGVSKHRYRAGQEFFLGDLQQGVVAELERLQPVVPDTAARATWILLALTVGYGVVVWTRMRDLRWSEIAWCVVWAMALALLSVRLILAYRCSLVPPDDSFPNERSLFHESLAVSLWALVLIPGGMLLAAGASGLSFRRRKASLQGLWAVFSEKGRLWQTKWNATRASLFLPFGLAGIGCLLPLLAAATHRGEDLFHIRTSVLVHLTVIAALLSYTAVLGRRRTEATVEGEPSRADRLAQTLFDRATGVAVFSGLCLLALLLIVIIVKDLGSFLYIPSVALALFVLWFPVRTTLDRRVSRWTTGKALGLAMLVVFGVVLWTQRQAFVQTFVNPVSNTATVRLATFDGVESSLLLSTDEAQRIETQKVQNNRAQRWQMLLFAARGASPEPKRPGYGQAPLSKIGMTYATSLADCVFSVYLLGELGAWPSLLTVALYVLLGAACILGAWRTFQEQTWQFPVLLAVGSFFAINGVYMAAANVGLTVFTGQNMPLLGLYSWSDVVQGTLLLGLVTLLMLRTGPAVRRFPQVTWAWAFAPIPVLASLVLWFVLIGTIRSMPQAGLDTDLDASPVVLERLQKRIDDGSLRLDENGLLSAPGEKLSLIERESVSQFNRRLGKYDPTEGPYYLERDASGEPRLRLSTGYFHISSPFRRKDPPAWTGEILARESGPPHPRLMMTNSPVTFSMGAGQRTIAWLDSPEPVSAASSVTLAADPPRQRPQTFGEFTARREGGKPTVIVAAKPSERIYCEGSRVGDGGRRLMDYDILVIEDGRGKRRYMVYLGTQPDRVAMVRWRNGQVRPIYPAGASFGLSKALADSATEARLKGTLRLTIDLDLQRQAQARMERWARGQRQYRSNDPLETKRLAVTFMDPYTGEVLAMPSFPHVDPASSRYEQLSRDGGSAARNALATNWNLTNHVLGSTTKPLVLAAIARKLRPVMPNIGNLLVESHSRSHDSIGGVPLSKPTAEWEGPGRYGMAEFLTKSRDWPECVVGAMGLVTRPADLIAGGKGLLRPTSGNADVWLANRPYRLDLLHAPEPVVRSDAARNFYPLGTEIMSRTMLFSGISELYGIQISANMLAPKDAAYECSETFLPSLAKSTEKQLGSARLVLPQPVQIHCNGMQDVRRDLLSFLLGGGENSWNNVQLAEAYSRLVTGRRVRARLEVSDGKRAPFAAMPAPLDDPRWREAVLIGPLSRVHTEGTVAAILARKGLHLNIPQGYRAMFKTGTLGPEPRPGRPAVDSECLMFTIGKWDAQRQEFVKGKTIVGFLYMQDSDVAGNMLKMDLGKPMVELALQYLQQGGMR